MARQPSLLLLTLLSAALLSGPGFWVLAQEDAAPEAAADASKEPAGDVTVENDDASAEGGDESVSDEEKGEQFADSAKELTDKLAQLQALLAAKGEGADPALQERLAGLQQQLEGLGLGDLSNMGGLSRSPELTDFVQACMALTVRKFGVNRASTTGALRRLSSGKLTKEDASKMELYKLFAVCTNELTEEEHQKFKTDRLKDMPKAYVAAAKKPEAEPLVIAIDDVIWNELQILAGGLVKELSGGDEDSGSSSFMGLLAFIPMTLMIGFLAFKFLSLQKEKEAEKNKKASKKAK